MISRNIHHPGYPFGREYSRTRAMPTDTTSDWAALVALEGSQVVEGLLLVQLSRDLLDKSRQVGAILLWLGPLGPRQDLLLDIKLHRTADSVDAVGSLPLVKALNGELDGLFLLLQKVIGTRKGGY